VGTRTARDASDTTQVRTLSDPAKCPRTPGRGRAPDAPFEACRLPGPGRGSAPLFCVPDRHVGDKALLTFAACRPSSGSARTRRDALRSTEPSPTTPMPRFANLPATRRPACISIQSKGSRDRAAGRAVASCQGRARTRGRTRAYSSRRRPCIATRRASTVGELRSSHVSRRPILRLLRRGSARPHGQVVGSVVVGPVRLMRALVGCRLPIMPIGLPIKLWGRSADDPVGSCRSRAIMICEH
jgi:hypothetical protein